MRNTRSTLALLLALALAGPALAAAQKAPAKKASPKTVAAPADVAAPPADAVATASGLASKVLKAGKGTVHPAVTDRVEVHYSGWTVDGKMFDSSVVRGKPLTFALNQVIAGWSEGVQLMVEGEKRRLWIPARLAYEGVADRPQGMLVFDVELLKIFPTPTPTPLPPGPPPGPPPSPPIPPPPARP
jgi:FKBP-type peptidyl-prolyl cis-trans isomerase